MTITQCIWCQGSAGGNHVEHIVPEVLGCPPDFILTSDFICQRCNNGLGQLDQAVADDFDFLTFQSGIPRKKGKPAKLASRGNVYGYSTKNEKRLFFNMDSKKTIKASDGFHVAPYRNSERNVKANFKAESGVAEITFQIKFGQSKKFQRGIFKIALSALAYFIGPNELYKSKYNQLRNYVRNGTGIRHLILLADSNPNNYSHQFDNPYISETGDYLLTFRLACVRFVVDLSESESSLARLSETAHQMFGQKGWTILPSDSMVNNSFDMTSPHTKS